MLVQAQGEGYPTVEQCIGQTPLVRLQRLGTGFNNTLLLKLEGRMGLSVLAVADIGWQPFALRGCMVLVLLHGMRACMQVGTCCMLRPWHCAYMQPGTCRPISANVPCIPYCRQQSSR